MRIAVIGTGISGLACAWLLNQRHDVTVYEAEARLGGHSNTVGLPWRGRRVPVDTGFIVYNERNYPNLTRLFAHLDVATRPSDMSFGVSIDRGRFEYAGSSLAGLLAQPANLARPRFHGMLRDIVRFNREARRFLADPCDRESTLGAFLVERGYGAWFKRRYLLPMGAAIWSASVDGMQDFPARTVLQFFDNHGLLSIDDRPEWRTVAGGSRAYVERLAAALRRVRLATPVLAVRRTAGRVEVIDGRGRAIFDQVVLACHADQALALIEQPSLVERAVLGAFRFQRNRAVLHTDPALMPKRRAVWSSWNYLASEDACETKVSVTYWMNRLQGIDPDCLALVSLNPLHEPAPERVIAAFDYAHPQLDLASIAAQKRLRMIQGHNLLWFCGAYWGHGFHEDGLRSGLSVAADLGVAPPWQQVLARGGSCRTMPAAAAACPA
jgi:predicted NAD/FAD-binding protein